MPASPPPRPDGRFAPSPTGPLHLGNLRTALLAWLFARSARARFVVRVEDLDTGRVRPGVAEEQLKGLETLGIDWDGPVVRPGQLLLARALGLPEPRHAHVPIVLGPDGRRLAKRHGAVTLGDRLGEGESPAEVRSWLAASAGLLPPGEIATPEELVERFEPSRIPREPTRLGVNELVPSPA